MNMHARVSLSFLPSHPPGPEALVLQSLRAELVLRIAGDLLLPYHEIAHSKFKDTYFRDYHMNLI